MTVQQHVDAELVRMGAYPTSVDALGARLAECEELLEDALCLACGRPDGSLDSAATSTYEAGIEYLIRHMGYTLVKAGRIIARRKESAK